MFLQACLLTHCQSSWKRYPQPKKLFTCLGAPAAASVSAHPCSPQLAGWHQSCAKAKHCMHAGNCQLQEQNCTGSPCTGICDVCWLLMLYSRYLCCWPSLPRSVTLLEVSTTNVLFLLAPQVMASICSYAAWQALPALTTDAPRVMWEVHTLI